MPVVGDRKTTYYYISNDDMGIVGWTSQGGAMYASTASAKKIMENRLKSQVLKAVGSKLVPGLNFVSWAAQGIALINNGQGYKGFKVTVNLEYEEFFFNQQGHWIRGWDIKNISISRYR